MTLDALTVTLSYRILLRLEVGLEVGLEARLRWATHCPGPKVPKLGMPPHEEMVGDG